LEERDDNENKGKRGRDSEEGRKIKAKEKIWWDSKESKMGYASREGQEILRVKKL
jgi:hypothetical protein